MPSAGAEADIPNGLTSQGNFTPASLTAWGADVFVALGSKATPSNITILAYNLNNNRFTIPVQSNSTISSSASSIVSMVAFQKQQLFILDNAGGVKSIQFVKDNAPPSDISLQGKLPLPLNINAPLYSAATPVPTSPPTNSSTFLQLSGATGMAAGTLGGDGDPHLFILDGNNNRILELKVVPNVASAGNGTPSATTTTAGGGGGAMATGLSMQLINQFASVSYLNAARSLVVDPVNTQNLVYVLTQDGQNTAQHGFVSIGVRQNNNSCPS
jgi:type II secretory pathway pseudopilin PulG